MLGCIITETAWNLRIILITIGEKVVWHIEYGIIWAFSHENWLERPVEEQKQITFVCHFYTDLIWSNFLN